VPLLNRIVLITSAKLAVVVMQKFDNKKEGPKPL
jgi:hypothetical protein